MSRQNVFARPALDIPDAHPAVAPGGNQGLIIDKCKTANGIALIGQGPNLTPCRYVPDQSSPIL
jgi:hypothetical protein